MLPLYSRATPPALRDRPHIGLWYDKFGDAWREQNSALQFEKQGWIDVFAGKTGLWRTEDLEEAVSRQAGVALALGGIVLRLRNTARFATGLGREHPVENGFAWHPTLGTPYLPGSGLKGVLRARRRLLRQGGASSTPGDALMGEAGQAGSVIVLDLLPVAPPTLVAEIMTPHYGPYYSAATGAVPPPADWFDPTPIPFLAVEAGQSWQCAIIPAAGRRTPDREEWGSIECQLLDALSWLGAGAKTALGYGIFELDEAATRSRRKEASARVRQPA